MLKNSMPHLTPSVGISDTGQNSGDIKPDEHRAKPRGDCYEEAFKFLSDVAAEASDKYILVHGNVARLRQDVAFNHAWVEEDDVVHELSANRHLTFLKKDYYDHLGVKNTRRYAYEEALVAAVKSGHYGPWA